METETAQPDTSTEPGVPAPDTRPPEERDAPDDGASDDDDND